MAKKQIYEVQTSNGVFKWSKELKPRLQSGYIGEVTINVQLTANEVAQIQQKNPDLTNKSALEVNVLAKYGITRETKQNTAVADKTKIDIVKYFEIGMANAEKTINRKLTATEVQHAINNAKVTTQEKQQLTLHFLKTMPPTTKPEDLFNFE